MDKHEWTVHLRRFEAVPYRVTCYDVAPDGTEKVLDLTSPGLYSPEFYCEMAREILRLAQLVQDIGFQLAGEIMAHQGTKAAAEQRVADLAAARSANDLLGGKINRLEEGLATAQGRADAFQRALKAAEAQVQNLEAEREERRGAILGMESLVSEREHTAAAWKRTAEACSDAASKHLVRIANLEARVEALQGEVNFQEAEIVGHRSRLVERENALSLAKETIAVLEKRQAILQQQHDRRADLMATIAGQKDAAESRGRQYCLELAEKAGRIRELEEALGKALSESGWHKRRAFALEAAIEAGVAHVEKAIQKVDEVGYVVLYPAISIELDMAHEALSGAAPRVETAAAVSTPQEPAWTEPEERAWVALAERVTGLEQNRAGALARGSQIRARVEALESTASRLVDRVAGLEGKEHPMHAADRWPGRAIVIEKRRHEGTGSQPAHFYACGPVRETLIDAITDANRLNGSKE